MHEIDSHASLKLQYVLPLFIITLIDIILIRYYLIRGIKHLIVHNHPLFYLIAALATNFIVLTASTLLIIIISVLKSLIKFFQFTEFPYFTMNQSSQYRVIVRDVS